MKIMMDKDFITETFGNPDADILHLQMVDDHDLELIEQEIDHIRNLSGGKDFCLKTIKVNSWNNDLSPWPAPAVFGRNARRSSELAQSREGLPRSEIGGSFGNEDFGDGAAETLEYLQQNVIPECLEADARSKHRRIFLGGYSLAGLFALWAGYQTGIFDGIAAASPSVWFPNFTEYMRDNSINTKAVYLSLGDREERTRNPFMSQVGNAIRDAETILKSSGTDCILEWNKGNHFKDPDLRTAKAFAWLMNREK